jgi:hypothetical protein
MLRIPHCLDNRLTDGDKVAPRSTPQIHLFLLLILNAVSDVSEQHVASIIQHRINQERKPQSRYILEKEIFITTSTKTSHPSNYSLHYKGSEFLTPVVKMMSVFCRITQRSQLEVNWRFGRTCRLHLHGRRLSESINRNKEGSKQFRFLFASCTFLARLISPL